MSGDALSELQEEIKADEWWELWSRYGHFLMGLVAFVVLSSGAYFLWEHFEEKARLKASGFFIQALEEVDQGDFARAEASLDSLEKTRRFEKLVLLLRHAIDKKRKAPEEALQSWRRFQSNTALDQGVKAAATLGTFFLFLEKGRKVPQDLEQAVLAYTAPRNPWRPLALEGLALMAVLNGKDPRKNYQALLTERDAGSVRARAEFEMAGLRLSTSSKAPTENRP